MIGKNIEEIITSFFVRWMLCCAVIIVSEIDACYRCQCEEVVSVRCTMHSSLLISVRVSEKLNLIFH